MTYKSTVYDLFGEKATCTSRPSVSAHRPSQRTCRSYYAWELVTEPKDSAMKVRAAVAHRAGAPLTIETVDLEGP
ncbi:MAG: hypothetical protein Q8N51_17360, partial [Gammaproteobacteria bacterium]|nr:hypothetical protein [Gammaproteobacteria bacterium]